MVKEDRSAGDALRYTERKKKWNCRRTKYESKNEYDGDGAYTIDLRI